MNIFVIAWNLPKERQSIVAAELHRMTEVYQHLGSDTLWEWTSTCGTVLAASVHTADNLAAPRHYVTRSDNQVVFYSGLPVNPAGDFPAHQAEALASHWNGLDESLEGMYSITRITDNPLQLEVQTDILGLGNVFYFHQGDLWLVSNSVQLIERINRPSTLDPLGVSMFLAMGWVGGDRTLRTDIRTIPGGQRWTWRKGNREPKQDTYYPASRLALQPQRSLDRPFIKQLANNLMRPLSSLGRDFNTITCALTGGRDSRLITALLAGAGVPAHYYTYGNPSGDDARIAAQVSQILDLSYEVLDTKESNIIAGWDTAVRQIVQRADGMYPLQLIAGTVTFSDRQLDHLNIRMWGAGGEIARGYYSNKPRLFFSKPGVEDIQNYLISSVINNYTGLIRQEGIALVRDYIQQFVKQYAAVGFAPIDIPDAFYTYERVGRRAGNNMRTSIPFHDSFSPFCTRPFIEAAFATTALQRCTEPLHYELTRFLSPELHKLPFLKEPWPSQNAVINLLKNYGKSKSRAIGKRLDRLKGRSKWDAASSTHLITDTMFNRRGWLEAKREQIREVSLSQKDSLIWELVDRSMFERITSSGTDPKERSHYLKGIFHIATLFYYDSYH
jgi:asparagine synthase (glutamine-hydrolysing)